MTPSNLGSAGGRTTCPRGAAASGDRLTTGLPLPLLRFCPRFPLPSFLPMGSNVGTHTAAAAPPPAFADRPYGRVNRRRPFSCGGPLLRGPQLRCDEPFSCGGPLL